MHRLLEAICAKIKAQLDLFAEDTAEALESGNRLRLLRNMVVGVSTLLNVLGGIALLVALLYFGRKIFLPLLGMPLIIAVLIASYLENTKDRRAISNDRVEAVLLEERTEAVYGFVRDAVFQVLLAASDYVPLVRPRSPSAIETQTRFYFRDGAAVFQFNALMLESVDMGQLREDLSRILRQKLQARELPGISSRLVTVGGRSYPAMQILSVADCGSSVNIDVILTDERSALLMEAKKRIELERNGRNSPATDIPADEEF